MNEFENPEEQVAAVPMLMKPEEPVTWASRWKTASKRWAKETSISYFANPAARRDFRVQFRGSKSAWLFAAYLLFLGGTALIEFWNIASNGFTAMGQQARLIEFYHVIIIVLGIAVSLVAPAMAAAAVVSERQRKSLDLVFCAPVRPRVYLLGKLVSVLRYTWILLALSLPFTAMSVILGGATWGDVLGTYCLLSIQGMVFTSIGLLFSSISEKVISSLVYTYVGVAAYLGVTGILAASSQGGANSIPSFFGLLNPFIPMDSLGGFTELLGLPIPNILLAAGVCFAVIRLCLATAGAALVPPKPRERADLRLSVAAFCAASIGIFTHVVCGSGSANNNAIALFVPVLSAPLFVFMPFLSCYGFDGEQRSKPNGLISWAKTLTGSPAGAITYLWFLIGACELGSLAGAYLSGWSGNPVIFAAYAFYALAFWSFFWAIGRFTSSFLVGLKPARVLQFLGFVAIVGLPLPILTFFAARNIFAEGFEHGMAVLFWILAPVAVDNPISPVVALVWALVLSVAAIVVAVWSERNLRFRLTRKGVPLSTVERAAGNLG